MKPSVTTTDIVYHVYADQMKEIEAVLHDELSDAKQKKEARYQKASLQRRVLHHIHSLLAQQLVQVVQVGAKGEKSFSATRNMQQQSNPVVENPGVPIIGYEQQQILFRFGADNWASRVNAILLDTQECTTIDELSDFVFEITTAVNDTIVLCRFEAIVQVTSLEKMLEHIVMWEKKCKDFDCRLCFCIDVHAITQDERMLNLLKTLLPLLSETIVFVFYVHGRHMMEKTTFLEEIIKLFSYYKKKLNIKNSELLESHLGIGRSGPYIFQPTARNKKKGSVLIGCVQSSIIIDMKRFFDEYQQAQQFVHAMDKIAHTLFQVNALQRRYAQQYFPQLYRRQLHNDLFLYGSQLIRFWNVEFEHPFMTKADIVELLMHTKEKLMVFAQTQRIIYNSCGMPCRFNFDFATAYKHSTEETLFEAYEKIVLHSINDVYGRKLKEELLFKEKIANLCTGGSEVRFQREGVVIPLEVLREIQSLLYMYKFPFFCYNFSQRASTSLTLQHFIDT
jgi:hypothetical protein